MSSMIITTASSECRQTQSFRFATNSSGCWLGFNSLALQKRSSRQGSLSMSSIIDSSFPLITAFKIIIISGGRLYLLQAPPQFTPRWMHTPSAEDCCLQGGGTLGLYYRFEVMGQITQLPSLWGQGRWEGEEGAGMTKVLAFPSWEQAERCEQQLRREQEGQPWYEIQILSILTLPSPLQRQWKVVIQLEFPQQSVRSSIIQRKKTRSYYSIEQLLLILELTAEFILLHSATMCEHLDIYAYLFHAGNHIKICNPRLLYETCSREECRREINKTVILRHVLELVLMERVIEIGQWTVMGKVREIYGNEMLDNLMGNLMKTETDLKVILTEYINIKEELQQIHNSASNSPTLQENPNTPSFTTEFVAFPKPPETPKKQSGLNLYQQVITESIVKQDSNQSYSNRQQQLQEVIASNISQQEPHRGQPEIHIESSSHGEEATSETGELQPQILFDHTHKQELSFSEEEKSMELVRVIREEEEGRFQGYQRDGKKYGRGKFTFKDGLVFDGYWLDGKKNGQGSVFDSKGQLCFTGTYKDDLQHGQGQIFNHECVPLRGAFDYTDLTRIFEDNLWREYRGGFREDWIDGEGTVTLSNGEQFQGNWLKGIAQGNGSFITLFGSKVVGLWNEGILERRVAAASESSFSLDSQY